LIVATRVEPTTLSSRTLQSAGDLNLNATRGLFNANLVAFDGAGVPRAQLAEDLPALHTDTWKVLADGRMETTYRLRKGLTWHDGEPFTADDYVFSWQVYSTPELGVAGLVPQGLMAGVRTAEPLTLTVEWKQPYGDAGNLGTTFPALPRHLLGPAYGGRTAAGESFVSLPFWTSSYVGLGPFQMRHWEPGAFLEADGFGNFVFGRPKIDRVKLLFINDADTVVANLLSGAAHLTFDDAILLRAGVRCFAERGKTATGEP
jgi:peptide/nickel transport system substrate-binding protein